LLFIFDQSSAYELLPPDALKAFEWTNQMVESNENSRIPSSHNPIPLWLIVAKFKQWCYQTDNQKDYK
jgi:hypothetical protein